ncbi:hypothetical protein FISHEDRAFT_69371 [Fistulina hepatica ATCC 64428]|uniref:Uncharacterized protein n=1 Tax=Fistulina hepatica ATCC 64428 TaxID=1128425 RepID=A0A0D7AMW2_9AGAR|nr:hypothetical protein FISHEDRAFT_69371 [Fistulina hepatica ATCC 64428]
MSAIRRKPQSTYRSPDANPQSSQNPIIYRDPSSPKNKVKKFDKSLLPERIIHIPLRTGPSRVTVSSNRLPLYHPLGSLAKSVSPLDPTILGLPTSPITIDDGPRPRSAARARRVPTKLRDVHEPEPRIPHEVIIMPAPPPKASPRKRRGGKRKRKDPDDVDATYPASKRSRNSRSVVYTKESTTPDAPNMDASSTVILPPERVPDPAPVPPATATEFTLTTDKRPEELRQPDNRRSTRSRTSVKRRDSTASASETTHTSASAANGQPTPAMSVNGTLRGDTSNAQTPVPPPDVETSPSLVTDATTEHTMPLQVPPSVDDNVANSNAPATEDNNIVVAADEAKDTEMVSL